MSLTLQLCLCFLAAVIHLTSSVQQPSGVLSLSNVASSGQADRILAALGQLTTTVSELQTALTQLQTSNGELRRQVSQLQSSNAQLAQCCNRTDQTLTELHSDVTLIKTRVASGGEMKNRLALLGRIHSDVTELS